MNEPVMPKGIKEMRDKVLASFCLDPNKPIYLDIEKNADEFFQNRHYVEDAELTIFAQLCTYGGTVVDDFKSIPTQKIDENYNYFSANQRFNLLTQIIHFGDSVWLETMPYRQFLQSLYWVIIRDYMRILFPECQLCTSKKNLHVHHKTYADRGWEWTNPKANLITLCGDCHAHFHNK